MENIFENDNFEPEPDKELVPDTELRFNSMEEFDTFLNSPGPFTTITTWRDSVDYIDKNSFAYKSFRCEFEPKIFRPVKFETIDDTPNKNIPLCELIPGFSTDSYIPCQSEILAKDMTELYNTYRAHNQKTPPSKKGVDLLTRLHDVILQEQAKYKDYALDRWKIDGFKKHEVIDQGVLEYINKFWQAKLDVINYYPRFYNSCNAIGMLPSSNAKVELKFIKNERTIGKTLRKYFFPNLRNYILKTGDALPRLNESLKNNVDEGLNLPFHKIISQQLLSLDYHPDVTRDKIAERLCKGRDVHIVMSSSGFLTLLNNNAPNFDAIWDLPFEVKELHIGDTVKKVVFIGKKLPPKSMTIAQRKQYFSKLAIKKVLSTPPLNVRHNSTKYVYKDLDEAAPGNKNESTLCDYCLRKSDINIDDVDEGKCFCDRFRFKDSRKKLNFVVEYNYYELQIEDSDNLMKKNRLKNLNLLIRVVKEGKGYNNELFQLSPKMEYQSEYGAEAVTLNEIIREWGLLAIRPNTKLARVRINGVTGEFIQIEKLSAIDLSTECLRLYKINPNDKLACLHIILSKMHELSPGNYILTHEPKNDAFAMVFKENDKSHNLNLRINYTVDVNDVLPPRAPWNPLDSQVITPMFHYLKRIPCTFTTSHYKRKQGNPRPSGNSKPIIKRHSIPRKAKKKNVFNKNGKKRK